MTMPENLFYNRSANELTVLNFLLTFLLSDGLNSNQLTILGNFLCSLGQGILTIQGFVGAQQGDAVYQFDCDAVYCPSDTKPNRKEADADPYGDLQRQLADLQEKIARMEAQLALKETQHNPNHDADADANQYDRQGDE